MRETEDTWSMAKLISISIMLANVHYLIWSLMYYYRQAVIFSKPIQQMGKLRLLEVKSLA